MPIESWFKSYRMPIQSWFKSVSDSLYSLPAGSQFCLQLFTRPLMFTRYCCPLCFYFFPSGQPLPYSHLSFLFLPPSSIPLLLPLLSPHSVLIQLATYTIFNFQNLTSGTVLLFFFGLICDIGATPFFLFCRFDLYWACVSPFLAPFCPQIGFFYATPI